MTTLTEQVQHIYAAFGRGDVPAILEHIADEVDWEYGTVDVAAPWLEPRRDRAGVAAFFQVLGTEMDIRAFAVKSLLEAPGLVVALVDIELVVRKTGRTVREVDEVHLWHFEGGRIVKFRHRADTYQHARAWGTVGA